jgi:hypothetical protein
MTWQPERSFTNRLQNKAEHRLAHDFQGFTSAG